MAKKAENLVEQFNYTAEFADSSKRIEAFLSHSPKPPRLAQYRQYIVYGDEDLIPKILKRIKRNQWDFELVNEVAKVFKLKKKYGQIEPQKASGFIAFLPGKHPNLYRLTTISYTSFWEKAVKWFVKNCYPVFTPVVFKQEELKDALDSLERELGFSFRIRISDITLKEKSGTQKKRIDTERWWTRLPIAEVFDQAEERGQWFQGMKFNIEQSQKSNPDRFIDVSSGRLSKDGEIRFDWFYDPIREGLVNVLEDYASSRMNLFNNRGTKENNYLPAKPIVIDYKSNIFSKVEQVRKFAEVISKYPNSTKAVLHSNPYYHANVADFLDGSSFEVWILSTSRIILVPQAKSTEQGYERLIGHIFTEFREGNLSEYE